MSDAPFRPLTMRQTQVAVCVARGLTYAQIATELTMSERTARVHVHQIAQLLPTVNGVPAYRRVFLWMHAEAVERRTTDSQAA